nr:hypothetical protein [Tanacetum cinerariifolium]
MKNGQTPLVLNYETFCKPMGLEYNNGNYVAHPSNEEVKVELAMIATHGTKIDIGEIIYNDLVTRLMAKSRQKYVSYLRFLSCALQRLLGFDYPMDHKFRSIPPVLSQKGFSKNPSKVTPTELITFMNDVINHETLVSLLPTSEKKGKIKTETMTKPKPKSQGHEAFGSLPMKDKKAKTKKTTLIQTTLKLDQQKVPSKATDTSQSVSSSQTTDRQFVKGFPSTPPKDGIHQSKSFPDRKPTDPHNTEGNIHPLLRDCLPLTLMKLDTTYQTFNPEHRIEFFSLNNISIIPNDTAYSEKSIRRTGIQQTYMTMITSYDDTKNENEEHTNSPMIANSELKIGDEFLKILQNNTFNSTNEGDVTDHITKRRNSTTIGRLTKNTKNGLWKFYVNECTKGTIGDLDEFNEPREENNKKTCSDTFYKPYLDAHEANDIYEAIDKEYSSIPIPAHRDISNPDELCQTKEFVVVRYSVKSTKEYIDVGPSKTNTVEKLPGSMSCIYHELFNKKDRGWAITHCK